MSDPADEAVRSQQADMFGTRDTTFGWRTTLDSIKDAVKLIMPPHNVIPIIFVPGIMGSNLQSSNGDLVWLLNATLGAPAGLGWTWLGRDPGSRQSLLHPARTSVYRGGNVPKKAAGTINNKAEFIARGWGEVSEASYHGFLVWLENKMNNEGWNPAEWRDFSYTSVSAAPLPGAPKSTPKLFPGIRMDMPGLPVMAEKGQMTESIMSDELIKRAKCRFPVYACGYNWLQSNTVGAERLKQCISRAIAENNKNGYTCRQVILVTHSMGGLVARACLLDNAVSDKIAGIVHGVMPATGAAVAYRRCKVGMADEDPVASYVIGRDGPSVTAVFAQAPGALQLLPSEDYRKEWLDVQDDHNKVIQRLPKADPYAEIYLRKDVWWGLVDERWLSPEGGIQIRWSQFAKNIEMAREFHRSIRSSYHKNTFVFYGAGDKKEASFETIKWHMKRGIVPNSGPPPLPDQVAKQRHEQLRTDGGNRLYVGGRTEYVPSMGYGGGSAYETSFWEIVCAKQDGRGDGTVPASSGAAPRLNGGGNIRQQFCLAGFSHEASYHNPVVVKVALYAITKITLRAELE